MTQKITNHPHAATILPLFIVLAIIYSLVTPPFEAGDESRHYAVVKYMADTGNLPVQQPGEAQIHWSHEGNQPPLYYALAAAATVWIDTGTWNDVFRYNPHTTIGNPLRPDNKNITIHPPNESWPWQGGVLAIHLIRFMSIAMASVTVITGYAIALRLFKGNRWLAAAAMSVTAFNPMFIFISASANNDNAVIMFATLTIYQLTTSNAQLAHKNGPVKYAALLGLLIGLGALSKLYAFGLLPPAVLRLIWVACKPDRQLKASSKKPPSHANNKLSFPCHISPKFWRDVLLWNGILVFVFMLVTGWFYWRNAILYNGDIFALQVMRETAGQRDEIPSPATLRAEFEGFRIAYWALFGGVNILATPWLYTLLDWLSLAALLGLAGFLVYLPIASTTITRIRLPHRFTQHVSPVSHLTLLVLLGWCLIMIAGFILWNLTQPAGQGRLFYPAIAAISALGILGLTWWLPNSGKKIVAAVCAGGLFLFAVLSPLLYIAPAYAKPLILTEADLPATIQPVDFIYDDAVRLIGYQPHTKTVRPAETLPITLYWQLLRPTHLDYSIFVHLLGRQRQVIGQIDSYPGGGKWPTTLLSSGNIVADYYEVPISPKAELHHAPARLQIAAGIYDYREPGRPGRPATNAAGNPVEPIIGRAKLVPWQWPQPAPNSTPVNFFDKVTLLNHQLAADQQSLTLMWQVNSLFEADYTVFIQAWDNAGGQYAAGFDGPPLQGDYPTSMWTPGETIIDTHKLDLSPLAPGRYSLLAGLYNSVTGERLPAFGSTGPLPDYAVDLGTIEVKAQK